MSSSPVAGVCLSALFTVVGLALLVRLGTARGPFLRASLGAHVLMCLWMAVMPWPIAMRVPSVITLLAFSALALGFVAVAVLRPDAGVTHTPLWLAYHAVMMAAMAWMAVPMAAMLPPSGAHDHAAHGAMVSLWSLNAWIIVVTLCFAAAFAVAAVHWLVRLARPTADPHHRLLDLLAELGMAVGMSAGLLVMG